VTSCDKIRCTDERGMPLPTLICPAVRASAEERSKTLRIKTTRSTMLDGASDM